MRCDEFRASYLSGRQQESSHLQACPACQAALPRLDVIRAALADPALWEEPPAALEERVVALVEGQSERRPPPPRGRRRFAAAAAAAVVLAAVGVVTLLVGEDSPPDWELTLVGTQARPSAMATVAGWNTEAGLRMELRARDLPAAPPGFYYELWMSSPERLVSAGTFRYGEGVVLWAGISRAEAPRLWVTLEPVDGDAGPSGVTVLDSE